MDYTFQILKAFIFTIGLSTFLQATSMSNKFAIIRQSCKIGTFLILASTMPIKLQGIVQRLPYRDLHVGASWRNFHIACNSFWCYQLLPFFARFKTIMENVKPTSTNIKRREQLFFLSWLSQVLKKKKIHIWAV